MPQRNERDRHVRTCKTLESVTQERVAIVTDSNSLKVPLQKRKEDAEQTLYLNRV